MPNRSKSINSAVGNKIRELRNSQKMTQKELAELLYKSESTVRMWELGKSEPDLEMIKRIAEFFDVSSDYILGQAEKPTDNGAFLKIPKLSEQEKALLETFQRTSEEGRMKIIQATMNICDEIENNNRVLLYQAASSEDHRRDRYITKDKKEWTKIEGTPDTDDPLL